MAQAPPRPANRPSRRPEIVRAALTLLTVQTPDAISVSDIAAEAGMTPAAFYYHFASKDELVNEIVGSFADEWMAEVSARLDDVTDPEDFGEVVSAMVAWLDEHERPAKVFFVTSVAATEPVEETRRRVREDLYRLAIAAARRVAPSSSPAEAGVSGVALIVLLEVASRARLQLDESYSGLGPMRFRLAAAALGRGVLPVGN